MLRYDTPLKQLKTFDIEAGKNRIILNATTAEDGAYSFIRYKRSIKNIMKNNVKVIGSTYQDRRFVTNMFNYFEIDVDYTLTLEERNYFLDIMVRTEGFLEPLFFLDLLTDFEVVENILIGSTSILVKNTNYKENLFDLGKERYINIGNGEKDYTDSITNPDYLKIIDVVKEGDNERLILSGAITNDILLEEAVLNNMYYGYIDSSAFTFIRQHKDVYTLKFKFIERKINTDMTY